MQMLQQFASLPSAEFSISSTSLVKETLLLEI